MATLFAPNFQSIDANGNPRSGAKLSFFLAGTTTPVTVYQDADAETPHTVPVPADASGLFPPIYLLGGQMYKFVHQTAADVTVQTADNIPADFSGDYDDLINKPTLTGYAVKTQNLSDLANVVTARTNLKIVVLTETAYAALYPADADTIYFEKADP